MMTKINNNKKSNDNNNKKDLEQKNFKENNFNENYYYTTMDLSKLTFIKGKNTVNNKNSKIASEIPGFFHPLLFGSK